MIILVLTESFKTMNWPDHDALGQVISISYPNFRLKGKFQILMVSSEWSDSYLSESTLFYRISKFRWLYQKNHIKINQTISSFDFFFNLKLIKKRLILVKKWEIQEIISLITLTISSKRIFSLMCYTGIYLYIFMYLITVIHGIYIYIYITVIQCIWR